MDEDKATFIHRRDVVGALRELPSWRHRRVVHPRASPDSPAEQSHFRTLDREG